MPARRAVPTPEQIPSGFCECGCGAKTPIARQSYPARGIFIGYPTRFVKHHGPKRVGKDAPRWKGGRWTKASTGYVFLHVPGHPEADRDGYVREHRYVMEQVLGRALHPTEFVHHINGVKDDNRPENLVVMTKAEHNSEHAPQRRYDSARMSAAGKKGAEARWGKRLESG